MNKYFLITKNNDLDISDFKNFLLSFLTINSISEQNTFYIIDYNIDDNISLRDALSSYVFDSNINLRIYEGVSENNIFYKKDIEFLDKVFNYNLKDIYYTKKELVLELVNAKYLVSKDFVLRDYANDYSTHELLNTFFMNNMNVLATSKIMYLHRNTLINKLERFKEHTEYDPKNFLDAYVLYTVLMN